MFASCNCKVDVIYEFEQGDESFEQEKPRRSHHSYIQSYALRFLEFNCNVSECLSLAEAPPTPDRLNDFGILKVPDELSEVIYLALYGFDNFLLSLHLFASHLILCDLLNKAWYHFD